MCGTQRGKAPVPCGRNKGNVESQLNLKKRKLVMTGDKIEGNFDL